MKATKIFAKAACAAAAILSAAAFILSPQSAQPAEITASAASYEYALFPGAALHITQGAYNEFNAYSHAKTNAFDLGGNANYTAPFTGKITAINQGYHMVMLQSVNKVIYADGTIDYMTVSFTHDNSIKDLYVGKVIKQGTVFYQPGTYPPGSSTGSHVHLAVFRGKVNTAQYKGNVYPNDALWLKNNTKIVQTGNYCWATLNANGTGSALKDGAIVTISPKCNSKLYVAEAGKANFANVKLSNTVNNASKWVVHTGTGYLYLTNLESGKALDIYGSSVGSQHNVQIYTRSAGSAATQNLIAKPDGAGYFALQSQSNRRVVIDCKGSKPANGGNVWTYYSLRNNTQLFLIRVVG